MMTQVTDTSRLNRSLDQAMHRPFTLTMAFIVGSVLLMIAAGFTADQVGRRIGEASTIRLGTQLAESDAKLIGDSFGRIITAQGMDGLTGDSLIPAGQTLDPLISLLLLIGDDDLESLFSSIDFYHMGLLSASGENVWSIGSQDGLRNRPDAVISAVGGTTVSWLNRDAEITAVDGKVTSADLFESLVPLAGTGTSSGGLVFHYVADITETLETNVAATQTEIRNTTLVMLGILLGILALLVLGLDLRISKRNRAIVNHERTMRQELDTRNSELRRLDEAKNEFLGSLSHELKTPLASILGFVSILGKNKDGNLKPKQVEQLEIVGRNGIRLDAMINDLLDLSRIQTKKVKLILEETEVVGLVRNIVEGFGPILDPMQQSVDLNIEHEKSWISVDRTRIAQVLSNLISNASKYSPKSSVISVTSGRDGDTWIVSVKDEGRGISIEDQRQLFSLFYRTPDALDSSVSGTGIGLFVSKQIMELHDGEIDLVSAPGNGTTVTFKLFGLKNVHSEPENNDPKFTNTLENIYLNEAV